MFTPVQFFIRFVAKGTVTALLLASLGNASMPRQTAENPAQTGNLVAASDYYPMVHLRKLHLVRPDLIPYPVYYSVYC